jgi:hypothetical protein
MWPLVVNNRAFAVCCRRSHHASPGIHTPDLDATSVNANICQLVPIYVDARMPLRWLMANSGAARLSIAGR